MKRGPKPEYGETRRKIVAIRMTEEQKQLLADTGAGTADVMLRWLLEKAQERVIVASAPGAMTYQAFEVEEGNHAKE